MRTLSCVHAYTEFEACANTYLEHTLTWMHMPEVKRVYNTHMHPPIRELTNGYRPARLHVNGTPRALVWFDHQVLDFAEDDVCSVARFEVLAKKNQLTSPNHPPRYSGERKNVIFACSATSLGGDRFRLFFGGGDGNVGTAVVAVTPL